MPTSLDSHALGSRGIRRLIAGAQRGARAPARRRRSHQPQPLLAAPGRCRADTTGPSRIQRWIQDQRFNIDPSTTLS
jgi:hypothetical protein